MSNPWYTEPIDRSSYRSIGGASSFDVTVDSPTAPPAEVHEPPEDPPLPLSQHNWQRHIGLYLLTCYSTYVAYAHFFRASSEESLLYAGAVMLILTAHEMGHFVQAVRYGVPASLPFFIPNPWSWLGTMGAVIRMRGNMGSRVALFDIGISGPLAGLVPAMICTIIGLHYAHVAPVPVNAGGAVWQFGDPLLIQFLVYVMKGPLQPGQDVILNPLLYAGWVGLLITSLNLFPIGQLDGGHILYALLRRRSYLVTEIVLLASFCAVLWFELWIWSLMLVLLMVMGPRHPPTANDDMPLGTGRTVLGVLTLLFLIVGFTPNPFMM